MYLFNVSSVVRFALTESYQDMSCQFTLIFSQVSSPIVSFCCSKLRWHITRDMV